jgi:hypothetical protein
MFFACIITHFLSYKKRVRVVFTHLQLYFFHFNINY